MNRKQSIVFWFVVAIYLVVAIGFSEQKQDEIICNKIEISFSDNAKKHLLEKDELIELIQTNEKVIGFPIERINIAQLEKYVESLAPVKHTQVYKTIDGVLKVDVEQRIPIIRIIDNFSNSYFIDKEGTILKSNYKYSPHILVATGTIPDVISPIAKSKVFNIFSNTNEDLVQDIYKIALKISEDEFWKAQFVQIYVNDKKSIELIPRVGNHIIELGSAQKLDDKLFKLRVLYTEGLSNKGWNQYSRIVLKYENQVVCEKAD